MTYDEDVVELIHLIETASELVEKLLDDNDNIEPREKFRLMVTADNLSSMLIGLTRDFSSKLLNLSMKIEPFNLEPLSDENK